MLDRDLGGTGQINTDTDMVLRATRGATIIEETVSLRNGYYIKPESFRKGFYPHWGRLSITTTGEFFLLTERAFSRVNEVLGYLLSRLIEFYIGQSLMDQVRILDIGGGRDATAAREIASRYPSAQVENVDIVAINESSGNFTSRRGDACGLNLPDVSIDFAYSHQLFPYMSREGNFARHIKAIGEVFRVLRPGGTGVIDFTDDSSLSGCVLRGVDREWDGRILPKRKSYGGVFLLVAKNPVDPAVIKIGEIASGLAA